MGLSVQLILVGATGLVGGYVLEQALAAPGVASVLVLARRALPSHPKLRVELVDFEHLPEEAPWWRADAVICTLGTTMRAAGTREAFRRVDHDYPLAVALLARKHGTPAYVLNSAVGADASSRVFYNRVKGELERDLTALGFESLTFARPGLIAGERREARPGEQAALRALAMAGRLLPRAWRPNPAQRIARALIESALQPAPGIHVIPSASMAAE